MTEKRILSTREAAEYLGISEQTLRKSRMSLTSPSAQQRAFVGPPCIQERPGAHARYLIDDLDSWIESNRRQPPRRPARPN